MLRASVQPDEVSYSTVCNACSRMGEVERAEAWAERMQNGGVRPTGDAWWDNDGPLHTPKPLRKALYCFCSEGPAAVVEHLERALELQWVYGFPRVPPGEAQLTHGIYKYVGGMQPSTAKEFLKLAPPGSRLVLDPFCGSGTVLVEALAGGMDAVGCDVSPLGVFVSSHHCDLARVDAEELAAAAREAAAGLQRGPEDWRVLRARLGAMRPGPVRDALWFVLAVAVATAAPPPATEDPEGRRARPYFLSAAQRYCAGLASLRAAVPPGCSARVLHEDNRGLRLDPPADAIVTSPPYPGVYDYLATAGLARRRVARGAAGAALPGAAGAAASAVEELGARRGWLERGPAEFAEAWQRQQEQWLAAAFRSLRPGGTATLKIGDGDAELEGGHYVDNLASTLRAAEAAGFAVVATATIESCADEAHKTHGMLRTEHAVHLRRPLPAEGGPPPRAA
ncbi:unnamed protein product, partial [Prorocentrum cordatum]